MIALVISEWGLVAGGCVLVAVVVLAAVWSLCIAAARADRATEQPLSDEQWAAVLEYHAPARKRRGYGNRLR